MANAIRSVNLTALAWLVTWLVTSFLEGGVAEAHPEWSPIRVNRYAKIVLAEPGHVRLIYTLLYGDGPALPLRKSADANADGRIDEREKALLGARAEGWVDAGLHLTLDGHAVPLKASTIDVGLAGDAVSPQPLSIDLVYALDAPAGPHVLVLDDRVEMPSEGDTEVSLDEPAPTRLLAAYQGRARSEKRVTRVFTFRGPRFSVLEDRNVTIEFQTGDAHAHALSRYSIAIGAFALLALAAATRWARRRRSIPTSR
jgi:MYXO-CTERM domain-containing protein